LTFALLFSVGVCALHYGLKKRFSASLLGLTLILYSSHLVLDFFTQGGAGIQLLWPFTTAYFKSPVPLFPSTYWSKPLFQHPGHLIFIIVELGFSVALLAILWFLARRAIKSRAIKI
jgi:inner membrane protein